MSILNPNMQKNVLGLRVISNFTGSKKALLNKIFFRDKTTAFSCMGCAIAPKSISQTYDTWPFVVC